MLYQILIKFDFGSFRQFLHIFEAVLPILQIMNKWKRTFFM